MTLSVIFLKNMLDSFLVKRVECNNQQLMLRYYETAVNFTVIVQLNRLNRLK